MHNGIATWIRGNPNRNQSKLGKRKKADHRALYLSHLCIYPFPQIAPLAIEPFTEAWYPESVSLTADRDDTSLSARMLGLATSVCCAAALRSHQERL